MDIKRIFYNILSLTVFLLIFSSCAEGLQSSQKDKIPLRLEAVGQSVETRAITSTEIQNTLFNSNQQIKTYSTITGAEDGMTTWGNPRLLKTKEADKGVNPLETTDGTTLYFPPGDNVSATIDAVYPPTVDRDAQDKTFKVASPQTEDADYMASDLMFASVTTPKTDQPVHLQFAHQMAKLVVNATGVDGLTIKSIRLLKIYQQVQFDPSTTPWQLSDNTLGAQGELVMASNGDGYTAELNGVALFPPQTYSATDFMDVDVKTSDGEEGTAHFLIESKAFEGGKVYTINMKIGPKNLQTGDAGVVVIAPWPESVGTINIQAVGNLGLKVESLSDDKLTTTNTLLGSGEDVYFTYNGKMCEPVPAVSDGKESDAKMLDASTDYEVTYYNNLNAGTAIIVVTGKGEYAGLSTFTTFQIKKATNTMSYPNSNADYTTNLSRGAIVQNKLVLPTYESSRPATQKAEVYGKMTYKLYSDEGCTTEYTLADPIAEIDEYGNVSMKKKGGPIYVKATMDDSGNFEAAEAQYKLTITAGDVSRVVSIEWTGSGNSFEYTGSAINPTNFVVKDNGNTLALNSDYTISYGTGENQTNVCTEANQKAYIRITGAGNEYSADKYKDFYFNIIQATNSFTTLNKPSVALGAPASANSPQTTTSSMPLSLPAQTFKMAGVAKFGSISYESSEPSVATVDENTGVITAVKKGKSTITVKVTGTTNYTGLNETVTVNVEEKNRIYVYNGSTTVSSPIYFQTTNSNGPHKCEITFSDPATLNVALVGAAGGNDSGIGAQGGLVIAKKSFSAGSNTWYVFCGGGGQSHTNSSTSSNGGWPGGACPGTTGGSGAGGGVTALCTTNSTDDWDYTANDSRILVAGAGGGGSQGSAHGGGAGGPQAAVDGNNPGSMIKYEGTERKKWMGGRCSYLAEIAADKATTDGGSGGAGYYGGLGGSEVSGDASTGGHGGSNYIKTGWTVVENTTAGSKTGNTYYDVNSGGFSIAYNGPKETGPYTLYPGYVLMKYTYDIEATEPGWQ